MMMLSVIPDRWRAGERKFDAKDAALAGRADRFDASVMCGTNGLNYGESKAGAAELAGTRLIDAIKSFEDAR
jgi:hypothetical protein